MRSPNKKCVSPLFLTISHLLPSLVLLGLLIIGIMTQSIGRNTSVLGVQSNSSQVRTTTVNKRLDELSVFGSEVKSEAIEEERKKLSN